MKADQKVELTVGLLATLWDMRSVDVLVVMTAPQLADYSGLSKVEVMVE